MLIKLGEGDKAQRRLPYVKVVLPEFYEVKVVLPEFYEYERELYFDLYHT